MYFPPTVVPQPVYSNMAEICGSLSPIYRQVPGESKAAVDQARPGGPMTSGGKGPASTPSPEAKSASEGEGRVRFSVHGGMVEPL